MYGIHELICGICAFLLPCEISKGLIFSILQCVAVCCSVVQCVAVRCSAWGPHTFCCASRHPFVPLPHPPSFFPSLSPCLTLRPTPYSFLLFLSHAHSQVHRVRTKCVVHNVASCAIKCVFYFAMNTISQSRSTHLPHQHAAAHTHISFHTPRDYTHLDTHTLSLSLSLSLSFSLSLSLSLYLSLSLSHTCTHTRTHTHTYRCTRHTQA